MSYCAGGLQFRYWLRGPVGLNYSRRARVRGRTWVKSRHVGPRPAPIPNRCWRVRCPLTSMAPKWRLLGCVAGCDSVVRVLAYSVQVEFGRSGSGPHSAGIPSTFTAVALLLDPGSHWRPLMFRPGGRLVSIRPPLFSLDSAWRSLALTDSLCWGKTERLTRPWST